MTRHDYPTYEDYRAAQVEGNTRKLHRVWAKEENIRYLAQHVVPAGARFGICHGTRRGAEQAWFRAALPGCMVLGTEISPTATRFPDTLCHDFQEPHVALLGADFLYSNSHDHALNPEATLRLWISQLKSSGVLMLEHTNYHEQLTDYNCWAVGVRELCKLLETWADHLRQVVVLPLPVEHGRGPREKMYTRAVVLGAQK